MKTFVFSLTLLFFMALTVLIEAEYYHYVDDQGLKHFTENYADVPEKYKPQIKVHKSILSSEQKNIKKIEPENTNTSENGQTPILRESLISQKKDLDKKFQDLIEKKNLLAAKKETLYLDEYNTLAQQLNDEILAYQKENAAYEQRVEQYNAQILQENKARMKDVPGPESPPGPSH